MSKSGATGANSGSKASTGQKRTAQKLTYDEVQEILRVSKTWMGFGSIESHDKIMLAQRCLGMTERGTSLLMEAITCSESEKDKGAIAEIFINALSPVTGTFQEGAVSYNNLFNCKNRQGETALELAISKGMRGVASKIIERLEFSAHLLSDSGNNPAVENDVKTCVGYFEAVAQAIVKGGYDLDCVDSFSKVIESVTTNSSLVQALQNSQVCQDVIRYDVSKQFREVYNKGERHQCYLILWKHADALLEHCQDGKAMITSGTKSEEGEKNEKPKLSLGEMICDLILWRTFTEDNKGIHAKVCARIPGTLLRVFKEKLDKDQCSKDMKERLFFLIKQSLTGGKRNQLCAVLGTYIVRHMKPKTAKIGIKRRIFDDRQEAILRYYVDAQALIMTADQEDDEFDDEDSMVHTAGSERGSSAEESKSDQTTIHVRNRARYKIVGILEFFDQKKTNPSIALQIVAQIIAQDIKREPSRQEIYQAMYDMVIGHEGYYYSTNPRSFLNKWLLPFEGMRQEGWFEQNDENYFPTIGVYYGQNDQAVCRRQFMRYMLGKNYFSQSQATKALGFLANMKSRISDGGYSSEKVALMEKFLDVADGKGNLLVWSASVENASLTTRLCHFGTEAIDAIAPERDEISKLEVELQKSQAQLAQIEQNIQNLPAQHEAALAELDSEVKHLEAKVAKADEQVNAARKKRSGQASVTMTGDDANQSSNTYGTSETDPNSNNAVHLADNRSEEEIQLAQAKSQAQSKLQEMQRPYHKENLEELYNDKQKQKQQEKADLLGRVNALQEQLTVARKAQPSFDEVQQDQASILQRLCGKGGDMGFYLRVALKKNIKDPSLQKLFFALLEQGHLKTSDDFETMCQCVLKGGHRPTNSELVNGQVWRLRSKDQQTILMRCADEGNESAVNAILALLKPGTQVARDRQGKTAFDHAIEFALGSNMKVSSRPGQGVIEALFYDVKGDLSFDQEAAADQAIKYVCCYHFKGQRPMSVEMLGISISPFTDFQQGLISCVAGCQGSGGNTLLRAAISNAHTNDNQSLVKEILKVPGITVDYKKDAFMCAVQQGHKARFTTGHRSPQLAFFTALKYYEVAVLIYDDMVENTEKPSFFVNDLKDSMGFAASTHGTALFKQYKSTFDTMVGSEGRNMLMLALDYANHGRAENLIGQATFDYLSQTDRKGDTVFARVCIGLGRASVEHAAIFFKKLIIPFLGNPRGIKRTEKNIEAAGQLLATILDDENARRLASLTMPGIRQLLDLVDARPVSGESSKSEGSKSGGSQQEDTWEPMLVRTSQSLLSPEKVEMFCKAYGQNASSFVNRVGSSSHHALSKAMENAVDDNAENDKMVALLLKYRAEFTTATQVDAAIAYVCKFHITKQGFFGGFSTFQERLITAVATCSVSGADGKTLLRQAIDDGHTDLVQAILKTPGVTPDYKKDALMFAVRAGQKARDDRQQALGDAQVARAESKQASGKASEAKRQVSYLKKEKHLVREMYLVEEQSSKALVQEVQRFVEKDLHEVLKSLKAMEDQQVLLREEHDKFMTEGRELTAANKDDDSEDKTVEIVKNVVASLGAQVEQKIALEKAREVQKSMTNAAKAECTELITMAADLHDVFCEDIFLVRGSLKNKAVSNQDLAQLTVMLKKIDKAAKKDLETMSTAGSVKSTSAQKSQSKVVEAKSEKMTSVQSYEDLHEALEASCAAASKAMDTLQEKCKERQRKFTTHGFNARAKEMCKRVEGLNAKEEKLTDDIGLQLAFQNSYSHHARTCSRRASDLQMTQAPKLKVRAERYDQGAAFMYDYMKKKPSFSVKGLKDSMGFAASKHGTALFERYKSSFTGSTDSKGRNMLMLALEQGNHELAGQLIEKANFDVLSHQDNDGHTGFSRACDVVVNALSSDGSSSDTKRKDQDASFFKKIIISFLKNPRGIKRTEKNIRAARNLVSALIDPKNVETRRELSIAGLLDLEEALTSKLIALAESSEQISPLLYELYIGISFSWLSELVGYAEAAGIYLQACQKNPEVLTRAFTRIIPGSRHNVLSHTMGKAYGMRSRAACAQSMSDLADKMAIALFDANVAAGEILQDDVQVDTAIKYVCEFHSSGHSIMSNFSYDQQALIRQVASCQGTNQKTLLMSAVDSSSITNDSDRKDFVGVILTEMKAKGGDDIAALDNQGKSAFAYALNACNGWKSAAQIYQAHYAGQSYSATNTSDDSETKSETKSPKVHQGGDLITWLGCQGNPARVLKFAASKDGRPFYKAHHARLLTEIDKKGKTLLMYAIVDDKNEYAVEAINAIMESSKDVKEICARLNQNDKFDATAFSLACCRSHIRGTDKDQRDHLDGSHAIVVEALLPYVDFSIPANFKAVQSYVSARSISQSNTSQKLVKALASAVSQEPGDDAQSKAYFEIFEKHLMDGSSSQLAWINCHMNLQEQAPEVRQAALKTELFSAACKQVGSGHGWETVSSFLGSSGWFPVTSHDCADIEVLTPLLEALAKSTTEEITAFWAKPGNVEAAFDCAASACCDIKLFEIIVPHLVKLGTVDLTNSSSQGSSKREEKSSSAARKQTFFEYFVGTECESSIYFGSGREVEYSRARARLCLAKLECLNETIDTECGPEGGTRSAYLQDGPSIMKDKLVTPLLTKRSLLCRNDWSYTLLCRNDWYYTRALGLHYMILSLIRTFPEAQDWVVDLEDNHKQKFVLSGWEDAPVSELEQRLCFCSVGGGGGWRQNDGLRLRVLTRRAITIPAHLEDHKEWASIIKTRHIGEEKLSLTEYGRFLDKVCDQLPEDQLRTLLHSIMWERHQALDNKSFFSSSTDSQRNAFRHAFIDQALSSLSMRLGQSEDPMQVLRQALLSGVEWPLTSFQKAMYEKIETGSVFAACIPEGNVSLAKGDGFFGKVKQAIKSAITTEAKLSGNSETSDDLKARLQESFEAAKEHLQFLCKVLGTKIAMAFQGEPPEPKLNKTYEELGFTSLGDMQGEFEGIVGKACDLKRREIISPFVNSTVAGTTAKEEQKEATKHDGEGDKLLLNVDGSSAVMALRSKALRLDDRATSAEVVDDDSPLTTTNNTLHGADKSTEQKAVVAASL